MQLNYPGYEIKATKAKFLVLNMLQYNNFSQLAIEVFKLFNK